MKFISKILKEDLLQGSSSFPGARLRDFHFENLEIKHNISKYQNSKSHNFKIPKLQHLKTSNTQEVRYTNLPKSSEFQSLRYNK